MMTTYDLIGDVHGHYASLVDLLERLGYRRPQPETAPHDWIAPAGHKLVSVGDLVDRGPDSLSCLLTLERMMKTGQAAMVLGNHEWRSIRMLRYLLGLETSCGSLPLGRLLTFVQLLGLTAVQQRRLLTFLESLPLFLDLDDRSALVVHARWDPGFRRLQGQALLRACAMGRAGGTVDEAGDEPVRAPSAGSGALVDRDPRAALPERARWVRAYRGPTVFWGHQVITPGAVTRIGKTINLESGCYLGRHLSAYSHPAGTVTQVHATPHWHRYLQALRDASSLVFPPRLSAVRALLEHERLESLEDYLTHIDLELEHQCAGPLTTELVKAHRAIFARVTERHGRHSDLA